MWPPRAPSRSSRLGDSGRKLEGPACYITSAPRASSSGIQPSLSCPSRLRFPQQSEFRYLFHPPTTTGPARDRQTGRAQVVRPRPRGTAALPGSARGSALTAEVFSKYCITWRNDLDLSYSMWKVRSAGSGDLHTCDLSVGICHS